MTNEERDLITRFIQRVGGAPGGFGASVPATQPAQPLPPIDKEADALIADLFNRYPETRYRITQMAFVQEHALVEAQNVINRLQWELQQAKQGQGQQQSSPWGAGAQPQQSRGFFSGLFGGGQQQPPPPPPQYTPPPPQYPPGYQPGMFAQRGSGFLGSALSTAAGVAGGLVAGEALMSLFRGGGYGGGFGGFGGGYPTAPVGFTPEAVPQGSPWGGGQPAPDPYDAGGAPKDSSDTGWTGTDQGSGWQDTSQSDPGGQDTSQSDSGWQDASNDDGGGWTDTSGSDPTTC
jgi:hypothetical protein